MAMNRWIVTGCAAAVFAAAWAGCGKRAEGPSELPARPVKMAKVSAQAPAITYSASGVTRAAKRAELSFERSDVLAELPVSQGQEVAQGAVLAALATGNLEILLKARQARFDEANLHYGRIQRLHERQAVSRADLDRAKAACEVAEADLLQVRRDMEQSVLLAPFSGRVAATLADRFQTVQAKQPVLVLQDISSFDIRINLPETFILSVGKTTHAEVFATFDQLPGKQFRLNVKEFATEADPRTLTYAVVFTLADPEGQPILPGMSANVQMVIPEGGKLQGKGWVPAASVFSEDGQTTQVWVVDQTTLQVRRAPVSIGAVRDEKVQILSGVEPGDTVAASGVHSLFEGARVKPYDGQKN